MSEKLTYKALITKEEFNSLVKQAKIDSTVPVLIHELQVTSGSFQWCVGKLLSSMAVAITEQDHLEASQLASVDGCQIEIQSRENHCFLILKTDEETKQIALPVAMWENLNRIVTENFRFVSKISKNVSFGVVDGVVISVEKISGMGYLVICENEELLKKLKLNILPEERLERMTEFYKKNWENFYQSENTFTIL